MKQNLVHRVISVTGNTSLVTPLSTSRTAQREQNKVFSLLCCFTGRTRVPFYAFAGLEEIKTQEKKPRKENFHGPRGPKQRLALCRSMELVVRLIKRSLLSQPQTFPYRCYWHTSN